MNKKDPVIEILEEWVKIQELSGDNKKMEYYQEKVEELKLSKKK